MLEIDARGLSCPEPVVLTRKAAKAKEAEILVLVDNICAVENVTRFGKNNGYSVETSEGNGEFTLFLKKQ